MKMRRVMGSIMFLFFAVPAQAEVYRWVDSQGRVQYSDQPPSGVNAEKINTKPAAGSPGAAGAKNYREQDQEFRKRRVEAEEKAKKDATAEQQVKAKQKNCSQARGQLASLQTGGRLSRVNEKGEREVLDDKGIEAATAEAKKAVAEWCK